MNHNEVLKILEENIKTWEGSHRIGRQHVIHKKVSGNWSNGDLKIVCGTNVDSICCAVDDWKSVECIRCLKKKRKEILSQFRKNASTEDIK